MPRLTAGRMVDPSGCAARARGPRHPRRTSLEHHVAPASTAGGGGGGRDHLAPTGGPAARAVEDQTPAGEEGRDAVPPRCAGSRARLTALACDAVIAAASPVRPDGRAAFERRGQTLWTSAVATVSVVTALATVSPLGTGTPRSAGEDLWAGIACVARAGSCAPRATVAGATPNGIHHLMKSPPGRGGKLYPQGGSMRSPGALFRPGFASKDKLMESRLPSKQLRRATSAPDRYTYRGNKRNTESRDFFATARR